jgi:hypothetical protein
LDLRRAVRPCDKPIGLGIVGRTHIEPLADFVRRHHAGAVHYTNPAACSACTLRARCTTSADRRQVTRLEDEAVLDPAWRRD